VSVDPLSSLQQRHPVGLAARDDDVRAILATDHAHKLFGPRLRATIATSDGER